MVARVMPWPASWLAAPTQDATGHWMAKLALPGNDVRETVLGAADDGHTPGPAVPHASARPRRERRHADDPLFARNGRAGIQKAVKGVTFPIGRDLAERIAAQADQETCLLSKRPGWSRTTPLSAANGSPQAASAIPGLRLAGLPGTRTSGRVRCAGLCKRPG